MGYILIRRRLHALLAQGVFVKQVLGHSILGSPHAAQVGHPVGKLLDRLHLLIQEVCFDEVTQLQKLRQHNTFFIFLYLTKVLSNA